MLVALGGNRCHGRFGRPEAVLHAAIAELEKRGLKVTRVSPILSTAPLGPSDRRFANAVLRGKWKGSAPELLRMLKGLERDFGRKRGRRWGARVLDCDLIAFGADRLKGKGLEIPHPRLHQRDFVLKPMLAVWPNWRHPRLNLTVRQMFRRLSKPRAVDCRGSTA